ncbi:hypothetical protein VE04_04280 [Pseudogymnoascus sp. 24MN13]|nr:hypothetical protein VE04_04280 [Pseudogymnoascus sp. 24MN13]
MLASVEAAAAESLSEDALVHLKSYKYSSVDESYISNYILKHYWNACVEFLPLWLAPNMVTLLGFFCIISNVIFLVIWQPEMDGQVRKQPLPYIPQRELQLMFKPRIRHGSTTASPSASGPTQPWTTSTASKRVAPALEPVGELLDHGIDSLNCTLASLLETAAMGLGNSKAAMFTALVPCIPMFFSTWETYHTHTLYLGVINGPTEGLIIACLIMMLAGHFGPVIWTQPLTDFFGTAWFPSSLSALTFRDVWVGIIILTLFGTQIPFCVLDVWTPMITFSVAVGTWLLSPHSTLMAENHLVLFCLTMAFVFGRMTTKIILAHLTRQPFPYWTVMLWPLVGGALIFHLLPSLGFSPLTADMELLYLRAYFVFAAVVYFRWAWLVVNSICGYLGINCLTIPEVKARDLERERKLAETGRRGGSASARGGYVGDVADARGKVH